MLDYNFVREKMGENPDLEERDRRFDAAVAGTGWPLVKQVKVCVPAGSVILVSAQQSSLLRRLPKSVWKKASAQHGIKKEGTNEAAALTL